MSFLSSVLANEKGNRGEQNHLNLHCHRVLLSWICLVQSPSSCSMDRLCDKHFMSIIWQPTWQMRKRILYFFLKPSCFIYHSGGFWFISPCLPNLQVLVFLRIFIIFSLVYSYALQSQSHLEDFFGFNLQTLPVLPVDFCLEYHIHIFMVWTPSTSYFMAKAESIISLPYETSFFLLLSCYQWLLSQAIRCPSQKPGSHTSLLPSIHL